MTNYDYWKTNADRDYSGQRTYLTFEEEDLINELRELEQYKLSLEYELDEVIDNIEEIRKKLSGESE